MELLDKFVTILQTAITEAALVDDATEQELQRLVDCCYIRVLKDELREAQQIQETAFGTPFEPGTVLDDMQKE